MARARTSFVCAECGHAEPKWQGRCPGCGAWNAMAEERAAPATRGGRTAQPAEVRTLREVDAVAVRRLATGLGELDRVLAVLAEVDEGADPDWLYWLDASEVDAQAGSAFVILKRPRDAEPLVRGSLDGLDTGLVQQAGLRQTSLARALAMAGDIPQAARVGIEAHRCYQQCPADWTRRTLRDLAPVLKDSRDPTAVELRERLATI